MMGRPIADLPHALGNGGQLTRRLAERRPAMFLDYDGTLTPIVDRPEDATISNSMRDAVQRLARRCPVCVVSGRDPRVLRELMGVDDLIIAGSHGFDISIPGDETIQREEAVAFKALIEEVTSRLHDELGSLEGALIEPKSISVAVHFRLVSAHERPRIKQLVDAVLAEHPDRLKVTPGKMVYEIQPRINWDKGKAVLYLLETLGLDGDDLAPLYIGDDVTDEDAFEALSGRGIGILVGRADDPELAGRMTSADYVLQTTGEVELFLDTLSRALEDRRGGGGRASDKEQRILMPDWTLAYDSFDPGQERLREVLTSTGNGYFCARAAAEWVDVDEVHYPGTYAHGVYNRETTIVGGEPVLNEDLVNLPNWLLLKLRIEGGEPIGLGNVELLSYRHELDVRNATMLRTLRFRDRMGRETALASRRFVSMADRHQGAIEWTILPENWSGTAEVISALDARVTNQGVARYRELEGRHLHPVGSRSPSPDLISITAQTRQSRIYIAEAARTRVYAEQEELDVIRRLYRMEDYIQQTLTLRVEEGVPTRIEKLVAFYTSHDRAINEPLGSAEKAVARYGTFADAFERHTRAWDDLWTECDIRVPRAERVQFLLRFHISHILQTCSPHTPELDAGVPARGLNGEAYRGHIFWDELYIYPFLNFRLPNITRGLLRYRYRRLDEARALATETGYKGAMYPWQSGSDGQEETQVVHLNPRSGLWDPDLSHNQRHVNAAIFYNIWHYYQATADSEFLQEYGAEMMLEIARFWSSAAHFNPERRRYEIHGVMGPDEFHEKYPGSDEEGLRNNAYTNVMVAWIADTVGKVLQVLPARRRRSLCARIGLTDDEVETWKEMSQKMFVPFHDEGIISQFEGYEDLEELDWDAYRKEYGNIQRLDRILKAAGDEPDRYKLAKQADTVLLFFLFRENELRQIFQRLGYEYGPDTARKNVSYYDRRTSHGSTLSFIAHAGVLANLDLDSSWERFMVALESDIGDVQGGTTEEGIHLGVMSGTLDLIQRCYVGEVVRDGVLCFDPKPIDKLEGLSLPMRFRGTLLELGLEGGNLTVAAQADSFNRSVKVRVGDAISELKAAESHTFAL